MSFAETTSVPVERTRAEIEKIVRAHGATAFASGWQGPKATIEFIAHERRIRFALTLPSADDRKFTHINTWRERATTQATKMWEQAVRSHWRCLLLIIKGKLEAAESGIETFEDAFMAHIVLPSGMTVSENVTPLIANAYKTNGPLMLGPATKETAE
jgi:hypothetical protein